MPGSPTQPITGPELASPSDTLPPGRSQPICKRSYHRGFALRRRPRLTSTEASPVEHQFYAQMIEMLVDARVNCGMSQAALSQKIGVNDAMVAKWESGLRLPSSFFLMSWCQALGVRVNLG